MDNEFMNLPVAVIGAGPIGLSAAVNLLDAGFNPIIFEAGGHAGANLAHWGHVRMFSPWSYNVDPAAAVLLKQGSWVEPVPTGFPTGAELLEQYVQPLASHAAISRRLQLNTRVESVSRRYYDILRSKGRESTPFVLRVAGPEGERDVFAQAVIDASGTYQTPNWLGAHGIPAIGEVAAAELIAYGVPDIGGAAREQYAGKSVLVIGGGHSAFNALQSLVELADQIEGMRVLWGVRAPSVDNVIRSPVCDELQERRALEVRIQALLEQGRIEVFTGLDVEAIHPASAGVVVQSGSCRLPPVERIIAATGFRPNLGLLAELRTSLDPITQSPVRLSPLIDPNLHSCGSVPEHGVAELSHPEPGLHIVGIKSYGRAPTFLMRTGYTQVKSVVSALAAAQSIPDSEVQNLAATGTMPSPALTCR